MQLKNVISFKMNHSSVSKGYPDPAFQPTSCSENYFQYLLFYTKMRGDVVNSHVLIVRSKTFLGVLQWCSSPT